METAAIVRALTISSLAGLLLAVGLRLTLGEVVEALQRCRLMLILLANFVIVPALAVVLVKVFQIEAPVATGMILLAAAPFAPVVPVFARLARADLALAAGLTSLIPVLSAFLTPFVCALALQALPAVGAVQLNAPGVLVILLATIVVPLGAGVGLKHLSSSFAQRIRPPIEAVSEAAGALSLGFVTVTELGSILEMGWRPVLAMVLVSEASMLIGYASGSVSSAARQVVALGTSNRNIALALLVALESFPGTPVVPAVVTNGLLLILLGLLHVAWWRFLQIERRQT